MQSYVDACLNGCLEIEGRRSAGKAGQLRRALHQDDGNWVSPWINDRIYPWRPFVYVPRAWAIDALLQKVSGHGDVRADHAQAMPPPA